MSSSLHHDSGFLFQHESSNWNRYSYIIQLQLFLLPFHMFHYPSTLSILAFLLPLNFTTVSQCLDHLLTPYLIMYEWHEYY
ncbi:SX2_G0023310.mRNA.1.CDS.1 [Saccharomyces cerevisiae]|nr:SX2_G0023310.mRNA.1.CDS.1 [Saccharomyces cerevisiae]